MVTRAKGRKGGGLSELEHAVTEEIANSKSRLIATLQELVGFRTPNPPGGNEAEAQTWIEGRMTEIGLVVDRWEVLPGRPNVVGVLRGEDGEKTLVLNSHIDVCEDRLLDRWSTDPYEAVIDGGDIIGRGVTDTKCGAASFLVALETLRKLRVTLRGTVVLQSVIGEETGEAGTRSAIDRGYRGDFAIVGEPSRGRDLVASIGILTCRITVESPETLHLSARRRILHAGGGLEGANCVEKMALRILPALADLEREWSVFKTHPLVPVGTPSINVFRIEGGGNPFILPDRCVAYVTVAYLPDEDREEVIAQVERRIGDVATLDPWLRTNPPKVAWVPEEYGIEFAPCDIEADSPPIVLLRDCISLVAGTEPTLGGRGGITDAGWFYRAGVPAVVFGPGDAAYAHSVDERVHSDDLLNHCKAIAVFLLRYCGYTNDGGRS